MTMTKDEQAETLAEAGRLIQQVCDSLNLETTKCTDCGTTTYTTYSEYATYRSIQGMPERLRNAIIRLQEEDTHARHDQQGVGQAV